MAVENLQNLVNKFYQYLDDELNVLNAQETLEIILRTDGKVFFSPKQVAAMVNNWAKLNSQKTGVPIYQLFLRSILKIYQANEFCELSNFDIKKFLKPFLMELLRLCPPSDRGIFKDEIPKVKEEFQKSLKSAVKRKMAEYVVHVDVDDKKYTEGEWIKITGEIFDKTYDKLHKCVYEEDLSPEKRLEKIKEIMSEMNKAFKNVINEAALKERLSKLVFVGKDLFNRGEVLASKEVLQIVSDIVDARNNQFLEKEVSSLFSFNDFNNELIEKFIKDKEKKKILKPIFNSIFEMRPQRLLASLIREEDKEKRLKLLEYVTVYEPEIFSLILEELNGQNLTKWYYRRNLIYLLTKISPPDEKIKEAGIDSVYQFIYPGFHPSLINEAAYAYTYLAPHEAVDFFIMYLSAEKIVDVIPLDKHYEKETLEEFENAMFEGMGRYDFSQNPELVEKLLKYLQGEIEKIRPKFFGIGKDKEREKKLATALSILKSTKSSTVKNFLQELSTEGKLHLIMRKAQELLQKK